MKELEHIDARIKMISFFLVSTAVILGDKPISLLVSTLAMGPLIKRGALTKNLFFGMIVISLIGGIDYFLRLFAVAELGLLFTETTREGEIISALTYMKVPSDIALAVGISFNWYHNMKQIIEEVSDAQASRGISGRFTAIKSIVVPVVVRAVIMGEEIGEAMESRGYSGKLRLPYHGKFELEEFALLFGSTILLIASLNG